MLILGAAACEGKRAPSAQGERAASTEAAASRATPAAAKPAAPASAAGSGVRLSVARHPEHGAFLTDAGGRSLYLLEEDPAGASTCHETCSAIWPPLPAGQGAPGAADSAIRPTLLGTVERRGGGAQVTYNGRPLYYYLGDAGPGETRGQHVEDSWGEWYLVSPDGRHVEAGRGGGRRGGRSGRDGDDGRR